MFAHLRRNAITLHTRCVISTHWKRALARKKDKTPPVNRIQRNSNEVAQLGLHEKARQLLSLQPETCHLIMKMMQLSKPNGRRQLRKQCYELGVVTGMEVPHK